MPTTFLHSSPTAALFGPAAEARLMREFARAAASVPAYRTLLAEHGVRADAVRDAASFSARCPILSKQNTFERFTIDELSAGGTLCDVADVLTSSGHGGVFSFGVISRAEAATAAQFIDRAFDAAFGVLSRKTLAVNCLPMGVVFGSRAMTVATTSVREDTALALVDRFGSHYEQIVLAGDPLFLKKLTDYARGRGFDWSRYRVHAIVGEEIFGERFRGYLASCLGLSTLRPDNGYVMSSFGVGELGLHLCYETPATIGLRRAMLTDRALARKLAGPVWESNPLPTILAFDPLRTFIEVVEPDQAGYGRLTISMLDESRTVPLLRYQTGDVARLLDRDEIDSLAVRHGVALPGTLPAAMLALKGRDKDTLPDGSHVGVYKDALYADHQAARHLTGAFRLTCAAGRTGMDVQLAPPHAPHASIERAILKALPPHLQPARLRLWPYETFPFGMTLDYERKFCNYLPGGRDR
jgi:phenylacetate-coenzyme A ligase PaaK-like adenylate-forming protein